MPIKKEGTEKYWTVCTKWGVPYPCRKSRTVVWWCYSFSIWRETYFFNFVTNTACEDDKEYTWKIKKGLFILWGSNLHVNVEKCFRKQLQGKKGCSLTGQGVGVIE